MTANPYRRISEPSGLWMMRTKRLIPFPLRLKRTNCVRRWSIPISTVIAAVEKPISALLDRCPTRVAFPCGERSNDLMLGIPGAILDGFAADDYTLPRSWRAHATGQSMPYSMRRIPRFLTIRGILFAKTLEKSRDSWLSE